MVCMLLRVNYASKCHRPQSSDCSRSSHENNEMRWSLADRDSSFNDSLTWLKAWLSISH